VNHRTMAPALLTNDKMADKKLKQSSKQNKRKMDPEIHEEVKNGEKIEKKLEKISKSNKSHKLVTNCVDEASTKKAKQSPKPKRIKTEINGEVSDKEEIKESKQSSIAENNMEDSQTTSKVVSEKSLNHDGKETDLNSSMEKCPETNGLVESPTKVHNKKKNKKKVSNLDAQAKSATIDFTSLKLKLSSEDAFISNLLTNIPSQSSSIPSQHDSDGSSDEMQEESETDQPNNRASNPEELQLRLAAKLNQFQGKKLDFSDKKMKSKLKRKLDKLEKKKLKRKQSKMKSKIAKLAQDTTKKAAVSTTRTDIVKTETPEPAVQKKLPKPIFNSEGRMVFSKFDFGELTASATSSTLKKTTNDPKAALHKIKKVKDKVKSLQEKGDKEKAKSIEEKKAWEGALQRAEGLKVKDSVELLTKTIKRNDKKKQQSKKKWDERIASQEKRKDDQQKKRKDNIKNKKDQKKEKKMNRLAKRGKIIV